MEKTVTGCLIEIGCILAPFIIVPIIVTILCKQYKDKEREEPIVDLLIWLFAIAMPLWVYASNIDTPTKAKATHIDNVHQIYNNKIEYGARHYQIKHFGIILATGEEPIVKIYTKSENEADKKAIENLLKGDN